MTNAVTKVTPEATQVASPEDLAHLTEGFGGGLEDMGREDYAIPFIKLLQGLSPEVTRGNPKYIAGAKVGDYVNSLNGQVFDGDAGVEIVRVAFEKKWIEWRPRKAGGGLVRISNTKQEAEDNRVPLVGNPDTDTQIIETAQIYVLVRGESGWTPAVLSWKMTHLKEARRWAGLVAEQTTQKWKLPVKQHGVLNMWTVVYRLTSTMQMKNQDTYAVPHIEPFELADPKLVHAAKSFRQTVLAGKVKAAVEEPEVVTDERDEEHNY